MPNLKFQKLKRFKVISYSLVILIVLFIGICINYILYLYINNNLFFSNIFNSFIWTQDFVKKNISSILALINTLVIIIGIIIGYIKWKSEYAITQQISILKDFFKKTQDFSRVIEYIRNKYHYVSNQKDFKEYLSNFSDIYAHYVYTNMDSIPIDVIINYRLIEKRYYYELLIHTKDDMKFYFKDEFEEDFKAIIEMYDKLYTGLSFYIHYKYQQEADLTPEEKKENFIEKIKYQKEIISSSNKTELDEIEKHVENIKKKVEIKTYTYLDKYAKFKKLGKIKSNIA